MHAEAACSMCSAPLTDPELQVLLSAALPDTTQKVCHVAAPHDLGPFRCLTKPTRTTRSSCAVDYLGAALAPCLVTMFGYHPPASGEPWNKPGRLFSRSRCRPFCSRRHSRYRCHCCTIVPQQAILHRNLICYSTDCLSKLIHQSISFVVTVSTSSRSVGALSNRSD